MSDCVKTKEAYLNILERRLEAQACDIARLTRERDAAVSSEVEFACGHTVAHEEDCPRCEVQRLRAERDAALAEAYDDECEFANGDGTTHSRATIQICVPCYNSQHGKAAALQVERDAAEGKLSACVAECERLRGTLRRAYRELVDCMAFAQAGKVCFDGDEFHETLEEIKATLNPIKDVKI